ncbi:MAG: hypothetical protein ACWGNV_06635, partial [Bacteroidales bacterium]
MKQIFFACSFLSLFSLYGPVNGQIGMPIGEQTIPREFIPESLDGAPVPAYDFQRANKLPMTGYFEKSFNINGTIRTAKFYISATAPVRSFFTVIAIPEGVEPTDFLVASGWHSIADRNDEGLVLLEPGSNGWGEPGAEQPYIDSVMNFY